MFPGQVTSASAGRPKSITQMVDPSAPELVASAAAVSDSLVASDAASVGSSLPWPWNIVGDST